MSAVRPAKLPFWQTVRDSLVVTLSHAGVFFRFAWPFLAALAITDAISAWLQFPLEMKMRSDPQSVSSSAYLSFGFFPMIAQMLVGAVLAVAWHRYIVAQIEPTPGVAIAQRERVFAYLGWGLLSVIPFMLAMVPSFVVAAFMDEKHTALLFAVVTILTATALIPFFRYVLIFPAAALGHAVRLRSVSYATRGNALRLACGTYLAASPGFALPMLMDPAQADQRLAYAGLVAASDLCHMIAGMPIVTFLSLAYVHFAEAIRDAAARDVEIATGMGG